MPPVRFEPAVPQSTGHGFGSWQKGKKGLKELFFFSNFGLEVGHHVVYVEASEELRRHLVSEEALNRTNKI